MIRYVTISQTVGPYFALGLSPLYKTELKRPGVTGEPFILEGRVLDGDGAPVPDALIEIWQANVHGKYADEADWQDKPIEPEFRGYGRAATGDDGMFRFSTIKPGRVPGPGGSLQAQHLEVSVFMRGLLKQLVTRVYFPGDQAHAEDLVLNLVDPARRHTLIAKTAAGKDHVLHWDVLLQGEHETVFFDV